MHTHENMKVTHGTTITLTFRHKLHEEDVEDVEYQDMNLTLELLLLWATGQHQKCSGGFSRQEIPIHCD